jgi:hypothetical protein
MPNASNASVWEAATESEPLGRGALNQDDHHMRQGSATTFVVRDQKCVLHTPSPKTLLILASSVDGHHHHRCLAYNVVYLGAG